ncbi:hypothetical protein LLH23_00545 [bacterium]|nr:hypothetical protein [bacterium]
MLRATVLTLCCLTLSLARSDDMKTVLDPVSRQFEISYRVPVGVPEVIVARCTWTPAGQDQWRPARVVPLMSPTATRLLPEEPRGEWGQWMQGVVRELRAAGLWRTLVFNPYPEAQTEGRVSVRFRVRVETVEGQSLATYEAPLQADNSDVVYVEDWSQVLQQDQIAQGATLAEGKWTYRTGLPDKEGMTRGDELYARPTGQTPLPDLTYPLDLRGSYAIYIVSRARYGVQMRLSGDERCDVLGSRHPGQEMLWRWAHMDGQHLIVRQTQSYNGYGTAQVDYVKLVPLSAAQAQALDAPFPKRRDKTVAGYFEPYSWAFHERITSTVQHREPLAAFAEAGIQIVDCQMGRFGAKANYETRLTDQLTGGTYGDPIGNISRPTTDNVGLMQQYTNTCATEMRYARELGMTPHANFGATNCYPNSPLEGRVSREHPEWRRGHALRYEVPEVQEHVLAMYREVLQIGAPGLSIDYCRYPEGIDKPETCNQFMRKLRKLADEFAAQRKQPVPVLVRFPAHGVRLCDNFDYRTWVKEKLVDFLCPSNIQGRHMHFDIKPYLQVTRGTSVKLLPVVDGLSWGLAFPGPFLWRVQQLYEAGVDGIYVYQADGRILGRPEDRRTIALLGSAVAVRKFWERERKLNSRYAKGIYLGPYNQEPGYHGWERLRVWTEGVEPGPMEFLLDGKLVHRCDGPPYLLGTEEYTSDGILPTGKHTLVIRARDGEGWLERSFEIVGG